MKTISRDQLGIVVEADQLDLCALDPSILETVAGDQQRFARQEPRFDTDLPAGWGSSALGCLRLNCKTTTTILLIHAC